MLTRLDIRMLGGSGTAPSYTVSIHSDSSNSPGTSLGTLTNPASWPSSAGPAQHEASGDGITLSANTKYWVVFDITANRSLHTDRWLRYEASGNDEDSGRWEGWSIGNTSLNRIWNAASWSTSDTASSALLDIRGHAISPPLVSNLLQPFVIHDGEFTSDRAQRFTTGDHGGGYKLTSVDLRLKSSAATTPVFSVSVRSDSSTCSPSALTSCPGASLGELTTTSSLSSSNATIPFSASGDGIDLDANTRYWVLLDIDTGDGNSSIQVRGINSEDKGGPTGWSLWDSHRFRGNAASAWNTLASTSSMNMAIHGDLVGPAVDAPSVTGVSVVSSPNTGNTYGLGETIQVQLTFDEAVTIDTSSGTPRLQIKMDPTFGEKWADYAAGSGTANLRFDYEVVSMNRSPTGIAVLENTLELNGGTIKSTASEVAASLAHAGLAHDSAHMVDGSPTAPPPDPNAPAQTSAKLVGNHGQTPERTIEAAYDLAQPFTTGSLSGRQTGFKLTSVVFRMLGGANSAEAPIYTASIHSDSSNSPGTSLGTLSNPGWPSSTGPARHSAPASGIDLEANTKYWVVFDITGNPRTSSTEWLRSQTTSDSEDSGAATGWSIGDAYQWRGTAVTGWQAATNSDALLVEIHGHAIVPPLLSNLLQPGTVDDAPLSFDRAQRFTTGGHSGGYKLTSVDLRLKSFATTTPVFSVSVHPESSTCSPTTLSICPGTSLGELTTSSSLSSSYATVPFSASGDGIDLDANTHYWVLLDVDTGDAESHLAVRSDDSEDEGGAAGWSLGNVHLSRGLAASAWIQTPVAFALDIAVHGDLVVAPSVTGVSVVSRPNTGNTYGLGETIQARLTFDEAVTVDTSGGTPRLQIKMAPTFGEKWANYAAGSGTATLRFDYEVVSMNRSQTGIAVLENTLELNGATIKSTATQLAASLAHAGLPHDTDHMVDGSLTRTPATPPPTTPPDPQGPSGPQPGADPNAPVRREPEPLQLVTWTDRTGYRSGETVRFYYTLDPHDDNGRYRVFAWLERPDGSQRRYLAPLSAESRLHEEAVDARGLPASAEASRLLPAADREMAWQGPAPAPGLWQFVLELRPGSGPPGEPGQAAPPGARRSWARFAVAERSQLLNRRGFDREVRNDLTLRSDTVYHLLHQLFVHDGATLTIEPGTLVRAWGPNTAIIVEPGGRIVAEGTAEAPVVLTCSVPVGRREPGCWGGLRILGRAPVTRLEGVAPGVLPAERAVFGGSDAEASSGSLRYVRVEFAGAGGDPHEPQAAGPAIGLYGAGSGTVLDRVQAHASLGDGFAFHGGAAVCDHCVASGSGGAGLSWQRGWRGRASHLYVQHGSGGLNGIDGGNDAEGYDREPRSLPTLSNVTLVHSSPFGSSGRTAVAVSLFSGSGVSVLDLLATGFRGGGIEAGGRSSLLFREGESAVSGALLHSSGFRPLRGVPRDAVEVISEDPELRDVREFPNPDPRPKANSPALRELPPSDREPAPGWNYIGAFDDQKNWLEKWTVFGPESTYDLRQREEDEN